MGPLEGISERRGWCLSRDTPSALSGLLGLKLGLVYLRHNGEACPQGESCFQRGRFIPAATAPGGRVPICGH